MSARDFVEKDYYAALGVPKDAAAPAIKKAYRALARDLHPDKNPGGEARFKEVSEAYDVLSDASRRREYDEARALYGNGGFRPGGFPGGGFPGGGRPGGGTPGGMPFDLGDVFGGLFNRGRGAAGPRRGPDLEAEVTLAFTDAVRGVSVPLRLSTPGACATCQGSGAAPGTTPATCGVCGGQGVTNRNQGGFAFAEPCRACRGTGRTIEHACPTCHGTGTGSQERTLTVRIPAGVDEGQKVRLAGRGSPGERGGPAGDLLVAVHVRPHPVFGRNGRHLTLPLPLTFAEAALGTQVSVPTLDAPVTLKIPAGTRGGRTFRVKGRGVPGKAGPGDLLVTVEVRVPTELSDEARAALEAYAALVPENPREHLRAAAS